MAAREVKPEKVSHLRPLDGPAISLCMTGKVIADVWKSDRCLIIRTTDGCEIKVAWVDDEGRPVSGRPAISSFGKNVRLYAGAPLVADARR